MGAKKIGSSSRAGRAGCASRAVPHSVSGGGVSGKRDVMRREGREGELPERVRKR